jgi:hypothetical protein
MSYLELTWPVTVAAEEAVQDVPLITGVSDDHGPTVMFVSSFVRGVHASAGSLTDAPALNCILLAIISTEHSHSTADMDIGKLKRRRVKHTAGPPHHLRSTTSDL